LSLKRYKRRSRDFPCKSGCYKIVIKWLRVPKPGPRPTLLIRDEEGMRIGR